AEERPAGMPRRRRNLHSRVNVQRAQRPSDNGTASLQSEPVCLQQLQMFPKAVHSSLSQDEELQHAKEEQERKEEEEYLRLKESFVIEDQGEAEELSEQESRNLLQEFIQYVEVTHAFRFKAAAFIFVSARVIDDRGKFIFITPEELNAVAQFVKKRGRVSISELVQASNTLINLTPELQSSA
uniref:DDRGK domain-containing protein 1-like n=1 Tax=Sinocyclocheilus grahami TaxID=75366 RepID=A0A672LA85_SINGR